MIHTMNELEKKDLTDTKLIQRLTPVPLFGRPFKAELVSVEWGTRRS